LDRTEVLERLEPITNVQLRQVEHTPRTRVMVSPEMVSFRPGGGQRIMEFAKAGIESMGDFIGVPLRVMGKLQPDTFSDVATQLLARKEHYGLMVKDGAITGVAKHQSAHPVNPERVLKAIDSAIPHADYHRVMLMDGQTVNLEIVGDRRQAVHRGDMVQAGAFVTFSPVGTVDPLVQSYVLRLACTNGVTDTTILREYQFGRGGGEGDEVWQFFRNSVRDAYNSVGQITERYKQMLNERIRDSERVMMLEAMLREAKITGEDADAVRALALERPPQNTYDLMNLITYASSHVLERPQQIVRAQRAAADFAHTHEHARECPICHARRN